MPLEWKKGKNPYRQNYFNVLKMGPRAQLNQIHPQAKNLTNELLAGEKRVLDDTVVDEHLIKEASTKLLDPAIRLEEVLMTHPPIIRNQKRMKELISKLEQLSDLPQAQPDLPLAHPLAALWFLPPPQPEDLELPEWEEFGLGVAGDETDQLLDIVFDI
jgi:hypothetical protein